MDARIAEVLDRLRGLIDQYGAERLTIVGAGTIVLGLLVFRWLRRRGGSRGMGGADRDYAKLEHLDISEHDRLYRVIAERAGWSKLPDRLLREFSTCLRSKENVLQFIALAERYRLLDGPLRGLDGMDVAADMKMVAAGVAALAGRQSGNAADLLRIAARIDPNNFHVVLALAIDHYEGGRYQEALPLLERGIPICRKAAENPGSAAPGRQAGLGDDPRQLLEKTMVMYEACLEQDGSI
ncbi:MAG: hypothetical protein HKM95_10205 [Inquilinus sp.]|nr:hypothetical protein [Inquilinus sp.]